MLRAAAFVLVGIVSGTLQCPSQGFAGGARDARCQGRRL